MGKKGGGEGWEWEGVGKRKEGRKERSVERGGSYRRDEKGRRREGWGEMGDIRVVKTESR